VKRKMESEKIFEKTDTGKKMEEDEEAESRKTAENSNEKKMEDKTGEDVEDEMEDKTGENRQRSKDIREKQKRAMRLITMGGFIFLFPRMPHQLGG
jgi:hypothetical protein